MQQQKRCHLRKLAIIDMIDECDRRINNTNRFIGKISINDRVIKNALLSNSHDNIKLYKRIKAYLIERYFRSHN